MGLQREEGNARRSKEFNHILIGKILQIMVISQKNIYFAYFNELFLDDPFQGYLRLGDAKARLLC